MSSAASSFHEPGRQVSRSAKAHLEADNNRNKPYVPHDVITETSKTALTGLGAGFFIAALRNATSRQNVGAWGVFTRGAPLIGLATAGPAAYAFFSRTTMNLLEKDDAWASAFGGFVCGAIIGMPLKRFAPVMALGAASGAAHGAFYLFGNRIDSFKSDEDEFERKMVLRKTTRVPLEQTISEIGEGRGIRPPGYEERRRQRLKERYDFDVDPVSANAEGSQ